MIRVKDPKKSLQFYCEVSLSNLPKSKRTDPSQTLGMDLVHGQS